MNDNTLPFFQDLRSPWNHSLRFDDDSIPRCPARPLRSFNVMVGVMWSTLGWSYHVPLRIHGTGFLLYQLIARFLSSCKRAYHHFLNGRNVTFRVLLFLIFFFNPQPEMNPSRSLFFNYFSAIPQHHTHRIHGTHGTGEIKPTNWREISRLFHVGISHPPMGSWEMLSLQPQDLRDSGTESDQRIFSGTKVGGFTIAIRWCNPQLELSNKPKLFGLWLYPPEN